MSTSLLNCEILLSKEIGDYFSSTTTSAGDSGGLHLTDTALAEKDESFVTDTTYDMIVLGTGVDPDEEERKVKSLVVDSGTLGFQRAHTTVIADSSAYRIHRLFSASEKRRALVHAAKACFPHIFKHIWDETLAVNADYLRTAIGISDLGLAQNQPHQVWESPDKDADNPRWYMLHNYYIDKDGNLYLLEGNCEYNLRIIGIGYLDFLEGSTVSTAWDATIAIDSPQTEILVAEAAIYLCNQMVSPDEKEATTTRWGRALAYWRGQLVERRNQFGMTAPSATIHWSGL